jgi:hypothetical protein
MKKDEIKTIVKNIFMSSLQEEQMSSLFSSWVGIGVFLCSKALALKYTVCHINLVFFQVKAEAISHWQVVASANKSP